MQRTLPQIHNQISSTIDDSLHSTERSLASLDNSYKLGSETLNDLEHQGQQLIHAQEKMDTIIVEQKIAARYIASIHGLFATVVNHFRPNPSNTDNVKKGDKIIKKNKNKSDSHKKKEKKHGPTTAMLEEKDCYDFSMLSDTDSEKLKRTNQNIQKIGEGVDQLKEIAVAMGEELDQHKARLQILTDTTSEASRNINKLERRM